MGDFLYRSTPHAEASRRLLDRFVQTLGGRPTPSGAIVRCPAHDDRRPSLSVAVREDRVLVHCHAGCTQRAVLHALTELGLWPIKGRANAMASERY